MSNPVKAATVTEKPKPPLAKVLVRRVVIGVILVAIILLPSLIMLAITHQPGATMASMAAIGGIVAVVTGGVRVGVLAALLTGALAPLAVVAGVTPLSGAALMALMCFGVGALTRVGLQKAGTLLPIVIAWPLLAPVAWIPTETLDSINRYISERGLTLDQMWTMPSSPNSAPKAPPVEVAGTVIDLTRLDSTTLAWTAVFFFVGAIVPVIIVPFLLRKRGIPKLAPHTRRETMPYTVAITVLTTVATYYFLEHPKQTEGAFLIATILVLTQIGEASRALRPTAARVLGTLAGSLVVIVIATQMQSVKIVELLGCPLPLQLFLLGIVLGVLALASKFSAHGWIYYVFITPAAVCLNSSTLQMTRNVGEQRLEDNLVGAGAVLIATVLTLAYSHFASRADNGSSDPEIDSRSSGPGLVRV